MNTNHSNLYRLLKSHQMGNGKIRFRLLTPIQLREVFNLIKLSFKTENGNWSKRLFNKYEKKYQWTYPRGMLLNFYDEYSYRIKPIKSFKRFIDEIQYLDKSIDYDFMFGRENKNKLKMKKDANVKDLIADFKYLKKHLDTTDKEMAYALYYLFETKRELSTILQYLGNAGHSIPPSPG